MANHFTLYAKRLALALESREWDDVERLADMLDLKKEFLSKKVNTYSKGMRQKLLFFIIHSTHGVGWIVVILM